MARLEVIFIGRWGGNLFRTFSFVRKSTNILFENNFYSMLGGWSFRPFSIMKKDLYKTRQTSGFFQESGVTSS